MAKTTAKLGTTHVVAPSSASNGPLSPQIVPILVERDLTVSSRTETKQ